MRGRLSGAQARITSEYPEAIFIHWFSTRWTWLCKTVQRKYWWWETHWIPFM